MRIPTRETAPRLAMTIVFAITLASAAFITPVSQGSVRAQETTPAAGGQPADPFAGVTLEPVGSITPNVAPDHALSIIRITMEPGAEIPAHHHPGAVILVVEEGTFGTTMVVGEGQITRANAAGTPPPTEAVSAGDDVIMQPGDVLTYEGAVHTMGNAGDEPLVLLAAVLLATDQPAFMFVMGTPSP
jgi:quercetin dioxygenase-like cupin family protein